MNKKRYGFTFIELIIAIGIISMSLPILFGLFFINLRIQTKVNNLQQVKREGDDALVTINSVIHQYARSVHSATPPSDENEVCATTNSSYPPTGDSADLYFTDKEGNTFRFYLDSGSNKIASDSSKTASGGSDEQLFLSSSAVTVSQWSIQCERTSSFSPPLVSLHFAITQSNNTSRAQEQTVLNYQTTSKLRN